VAARLQTRHQAKRRERAVATPLTSRRGGGALAPHLRRCAAIALERFLVTRSRELA
jgi:hypothetical protein